MNENIEGGKVYDKGLTNAIYMLELTNISQNGVLLKEAATDRSVRRFNRSGLSVLNIANS